MIAAMKIRPDWRERLAAIVEKDGGKRATISKRAGLGATYLRDLLNPDRDVTPNIERASKLSSDGLGVPLHTWFIEPDQDDGNQTNVKPAVSQLTASTTGDLLRVFGATEGGSDGSFHFNGEIVDRVPRPPFLTGSRDAYALYVMGDSMAPRYFQGELVYVHPGQPVSPGMDVVVQVRDRNNPTTNRALLKRLVRRTEKALILEQYNPAKRIEIPAGDVVSVHRVKGRGEG